MKAIHQKQERRILVRAIIKEPMEAHRRWGLRSIPLCQSVRSQHQYGAKKVVVIRPRTSKYVVSAGIGTERLCATARSVSIPLRDRECCCKNCTRSCVDTPRSTQLKVRNNPENEQLQATTDKQTSCHTSHDQTSNETSEYRGTCRWNDCQLITDLISWVIKWEVKFATIVS